MRYRNLLILAVVFLIAAMPCFGLIGSTSTGTTTQSRANATGSSFYWFNNSLTSGDLFKLLAPATTSGNLIKLVADDDALAAAGTLGTSGAYIQCLGGTAQTTNVFELQEGGVIQLKGSATINNAADAAVLNLTETTVRATGDFDVTGTTTSAGAAALNGGITVDSTAFAVANTTGNVTGTGTIDPTVTNTVAGGERAINANITQSTNAITGTLDGIYSRATGYGTNSTTGTVRGAELGGRLPDADGAKAANLISGVYAWADAKIGTASLLRVYEASIDGGGGSTVTEGVGMEIFNNSSGTITNSYALSVNKGDPTDGPRAAFTKDIRLQYGETIDNATNGTINVSGLLKGNHLYATVVVNTDGSETLAATQSGALVTCSAAGGATTITLPDPSAATIGVVYEIMQIANQDVIIVPTTATGNSLVAKGVATSDSVTLSNGTNKIGVAGKVIGISATQWFVMGYAESTLTVEAAD